MKNARIPNPFAQMLEISVVELFGSFLLAIALTTAKTIAVKRRSPKITR
jgi:hypothetical protein